MYLRIIQILINILFVFSLSAQTYDTGNELIEIPNVSFEYFEDKVLNQKEIDSPKGWEELLQYYSTLKDTSDVRNLFTDIDSNAMNRYAHFIDQQNNDGVFNTQKIDFKLDVTVKGNKLSYIYVRLYKDDKFITFYKYVLVEINGQLKLAGGEIIRQVPRFQVLLRIKPDKLYHLFTGQLTDDTTLNQVIKNTRYKDGFDLDRFERLVSKWHKEKNEKMLNYFYYQR